jgi:hypothetical protein
MHKNLQRTASPTAIALLLIALAVVELAVRPLADSGSQLAVNMATIVVAALLLVLTIASLRS